MPQVEIAIGGRIFEVACQEGEEHYLHSAAAMLDNEASHLSSQIGRMPEARMLLMSALMLADRTAGLEDKVREAEQRIADLRAELDARDAAPPPPAEMPRDLIEMLEDIAASAEDIADSIAPAS